MHLDAGGPLLATLLVLLQLLLLGTRQLQATPVAALRDLVADGAGSGGDDLMNKEPDSLETRTAMTRGDSTCTLNYVWDMMQKSCESKRKRRRREARSYWGWGDYGDDGGYDYGGYGGYGGYGDYSYSYDSGPAGGWGYPDGGYYGWRVTRSATKSLMKICCERVCDERDFEGVCPS